MKKKVFYLLIILSFFQVSGQDLSVSGVVVDSITKEPLSFANIYLLETQRGTTSSENGHFELKNLETFKRLRFGYVGYQTKDVNYAEEIPDTIRLDRNSEKLSEVFIQVPKFKKKVKLNAGRGRNNIGISNTGSGENPGALMRFFEKPSEFEKEPAFLKSAEFFLNKNLDSENKDYIFRIRIMSVGENGYPGYDLLENTTLQGKPGSKIAIDLSDENIVIPEKGFFIGVEGLQIPQNYIRTVEFPSTDGESKMIKTYGPTFKAVRSIGSVFYYGAGDWRKMSRLPVPAINLVITN